MNIDDLTIGEAKAIAQQFSTQNCGSHSFQVGKAYLIRTVTMHYTGRVVAVTDTDVLLEDAAWIANTGRYGNCLEEGTLDEVEPYPNGVAVSRGCIVDFAVWQHPLPREQK